MDEPLTEQEIEIAIEELREIINTADPDEDKLLHFGLIRLLTTLDSLRAENARLQERVEEAERQVKQWKTGYRQAVEEGSSVLAQYEEANAHLEVAEDTIEEQHMRIEGDAAQSRVRLEALEARERARLVKEEYYRQCDLGQPPSEGWEKLDFVDVTGARLHADGLYRDAIAITPGEALKKEGR